MSGEAQGSAIFDTGAGVTSVTSAFANKSKVEVRPFDTPGIRRVRLPDGKLVDALGVCTLPMRIQLLLDSGNNNMVHWDRVFDLEGVWVLPLGDNSPRDLYISEADFAAPQPGEQVSPLAQLHDLVNGGATLCDEQRAPPTGTPLQRMVIARFVEGDDVAPSLASLDTVDDSELEALRERIRARIPEDQRDTPFAKTLVDELLSRRKLFGPVDPKDCTQTVEFTVIGEPEQVSFRVNLPRGVSGEAAAATLSDWLERGLAEKVPWSTPSYGFAFVVPKPRGRGWRLTINPQSTNKYTKRIDPPGGFMPQSMINEAMRVGGQKLAITLDLSEAFTTGKLGPEAQRLSTFTTPVGKVRWLHGYFGWHSFPAWFQKTIMEVVVLPSLDVVPTATIIAWIDDLVIAAKDNFTLLQALLEVLDRILSFGGRLSLDKCSFLVDKFDWCGVAVNLTTREWAISHERVSSLLDTPIPENREDLGHVLGILRYYFFGVHDQIAQRARLAKLSELNVSGLRDFKDKWTDEHTTAMRDALKEIVNGKWALIYDPSLPVYVTTDAATGHGYSVIANQYDPRTGELRPIGFYSTGWKGAQVLGWVAQVKESYAQRQAVCVIMPKHFPYAKVVLLTDNKNLGRTESADQRVTRWEKDITASGCHKRCWIPGKWNTIADYGSRAVRADADAKLSEEEEFELHIYAMEAEEVTVAPTNSIPAAKSVVPGHLPASTLAASIISAQLAAPEGEKATWSGTNYTRAMIMGKELAFFKNRLVLPLSATDLKLQLLRYAHDSKAHYTGYVRTLQTLHEQAKVHWEGMADDVQRYVKSCFRCAFAKAPSHSPARVGTLEPTVPPHVHHTWYADLKGPLPHGTGYILVSVEAVSRFVKLRYLPAANAKEVCEELTEIVNGFGTCPVVLRTDGGPPFDSDEYRDYCADMGITPVLGLPHHSQGQGMVETRIRGLAASIIATLGHKAPRDWLAGKLLDHLEGVINTTRVGPTGNSPFGVLFGREPRTPLSSVGDWSAPNCVSTLIGAEVTLHDLNEIIAEHHASVDAAQNLAMLSTTVEQAITKREWDASRKPSNYKVGQWVLLHHAAPNRLLPWFDGPYQVVEITPGNNSVRARHFLDPLGKTGGPYHVSRLLPFDFSRATAQEIAQFQLEAGSEIVESVLGHRTLHDGTNEFNIQWLGSNITSWLAGAALTKVIKVINYCAANNLAPPGKEPKHVPLEHDAVRAGGRGGLRGRGRGRGGRSVTWDLSPRGAAS